MEKIVILCFLMVCFLTSPAQKVIPDFKATQVSDGKIISLGTYRSNKAVVVVFTSNACAYDGYYEGRIRSLIADYKGAVPFLLVNAYLEPEEDAVAMKKKSDVWNLGVPYLTDKDQKIMESFGAKKSPEVFLLKNESGKFIVAYSGAIDDNSQLADAVNENYLRDAIDNLLAGKPAGESVRTTGCTIRRK